MKAWAAAMTGAAAVAVLAIVGVILFRSDGSPVNEPQGLASGPPDAPVRGCRDRVEGPRTIRPKPGDTTIGPLAFKALPAIYLDGATRPESWVRFPRYGMPAIKVIAVVRAGARATLVVPPTQRAWMKLIYQRPERGGTHTITLEACRSVASRLAAQRECGWRPYRACMSGYTNFRRVRDRLRQRCARPNAARDGSEGVATRVHRKGSV